MPSYMYIYIYIYVYMYINAYVHICIHTYSKMHTYIGRLRLLGVIYLRSTKSAGTDTYRNSFFDCWSSFEFAKQDHIPAYITYDTNR